MHQIIKVRSFQNEFKLDRHIFLITLFRIFKLIFHSVYKRDHHGEPETGGAMPQGGANGDYHPRADLQGLSLSGPARFYASRMCGRTKNSPARRGMARR